MGLSMTGTARTTDAICGRVTPVLLRLVGAALAALVATMALADTQPRSWAGDVPGVLGPLLADDSGLIGAISRWIDESAATVSSHLKGARESLDDAGGRAGEVAKDAAGAVARLKPTVVAGRERCPTAQNGAPDCSSAIAALCRTKGFAGGRSLDIEATRKCPADMLLSGRLPAPSECPSESHVTRALCQ
jgi:hypothetical protein